MKTNPNARYMVLTAEWANTTMSVELVDLNREEAYELAQEFLPDHKIVRVVEYTNLDTIIRKDVTK